MMDLAEFECGVIIANNNLLIPKLTPVVFPHIVCCY